MYWDAGSCLCMRRLGLGVGLLVFLVVLAGCGSYPFGDPPAQEEPAPVKLVNNASQTETFTVAVVEVGKNLTLTWGNNTSDSTTGNISISSGSLTYHKGGLYRVRLPDSARIHSEYTLDPGEEKQIEVENLAPDEAIVVLVFDEEDGTYRSIKSLSCDGAIQGYHVTSQKGGSEDWTMSTHGCNNWF